ncbi:hypothetical protein QR685DRAFT_585160 [Neurospora intermedia]|uniref:Uncharacterized protein n=1 Tax=Neurospora intermedia TaxID=5142 RepID=A0ABR3DI17_NEUIN
MRFTSTLAVALTATTPLVLASSGGSVEQRSDAAAAAAWTCTPAYNYCGWFLMHKNPADWDGVLDPDGLYQCLNGGVVNHLSTCINSCELLGPTAHCK